jgi:hypothetical protein
MHTRRVTNPVRQVVRAGLIAGSLDIAAAILIYGLRGVRPIRILQSVASGLLGVGAFQGGIPAAGLGLVLHFLIACVAAWVYYVASLRMQILVSRPLPLGAAYGVAVYIFMNFVVVPLSAAPKRPFALRMALLMLLVHVVCVGIPIAVTLGRAAISQGDGAAEQGDEADKA